LLSFTNVYFFESGLFNGLQPIQTKKILRSRDQPVLVVKVDAATPLIASSGRLREFAAFELVISEDHSPRFCSAQENVEMILNSRSPLA
jgi:hypothetical protein